MTISINDFQRISNGSFNAGDITLASNGNPQISARHLSQTFNMD